ncbi:hypothetical protein TNCV_4302821 [Trichonephila clavipes]|nr:hypothetical protein TNCV_4302821 [Trichonephila clavipes]
MKISQVPVCSLLIRWYLKAKRQIPVKVKLTMGTNHPFHLHVKSFGQEKSRRADGSRNDIYYYVEGMNGCDLVMQRCAEHNIKYNEDLFYFKGSNTFEGVVNLLHKVYLEFSEKDLVC